MSLTSYTTRDNFLDFAKGSLILLVVLGHLIQYGFSDYANIYLYRLIYSFHMPLFFLCSGAALCYASSKYNQSTSETIRQYFRHLIVPYAIWSLLFLLLIERNGSPAEILTNPFAFFWYLENLFFCLVIALLILARDTSRRTIAVLAILSAYEISYFVATGHVHLKYSLYYLAYVIAGYGILKSHILRATLSYMAARNFATRLFLIAAIFLLIDALLGIYNHPFAFSSFLLTIAPESTRVAAAIAYLMRFIIVILALLIVVILSKTVYGDLARFIAMIGVFSLEIYISHLFVIRAFAAFQPSFVHLAFASTAFTFAIFVVLRLISQQPRVHGLYRVLFGRIPRVNQY